MTAVGIGLRIAGNVDRFKGAGIAALPSLLRTEPQSGQLHSRGCVRKILRGLA
jgi:hypothetical protein